MADTRHRVLERHAAQGGGPEAQAAAQRELIRQGLCPWCKGEKFTEQGRSGEPMPLCCCERCWRTGSNVGRRKPAVLICSRCPIRTVKEAHWKAWHERRDREARERQEAYLG